MCRKAQKAEGDLRRATADLRAREREREAAESRAAAAQAENEKGSNSSSAMTTAKRVRLATTPYSPLAHMAFPTCFQLQFCFTACVATASLLWSLRECSMLAEATTV